MVTLSGARRFWPWAALVLGRFITSPLRSAASILSDGRSHPLSIHAIPAQAAGIGTRSLGTGYISQPFSGGVVFYFYFLFLILIFRRITHYCLPLLGSMVLVLIVFINTLR
jgi:hypothetical protein